MITLDSLVGVFAPHLCIVCGSEGSVMCSECLETAGEPIVPRCAGCHKLSDDYKTCSSCKSWLKADRVYVATVYEGIYEALIHSLKFDCKRQAAEPIAEIISETIGEISSETLICPLPTAPSRIRERGFDHTKLVAKNLESILKLKNTKLLGRKSNVRQVGSTRAERLEQMDQEFYIVNLDLVKGKNILLIDDVVTTGASISGASKTLKQNGAKSVFALVFAQKI